MSYGCAIMPVCFTSGLLVVVGSGGARIFKTSVGGRFFVCVRACVCFILGQIYLSNNVNIDPAPPSTRKHHQQDNLNTAITPTPFPSPWKQGLTKNMPLPYTFDCSVLYIQIEFRYENLTLRHAYNGNYKTFKEISIF